MARPLGLEDDLELRRPLDVGLDRAVVDRLDQRIPVFPGEPGRRGDLDRDLVDHLGDLAPFGGHDHAEPLGGDPALLAEGQRIVTGARGERDEKEIERGRGGPVAPIVDRLVGLDGEAFVFDVDPVVLSEDDLQLFRVHGSSFPFALGRPVRSRGPSKDLRNMARMMSRSLAVRAMRKKMSRTFSTMKARLVSCMKPRLSSMAAKRRPASAWAAWSRSRSRRRAGGGPSRKATA